MPIDHSSFANQATSLISRLSKWPVHFGTLASFYSKARKFNLCLSGQMEELFILMPHWIYLYSNTINQLFRIGKEQMHPLGPGLCHPRGLPKGIQLN